MGINFGLLFAGQNQPNIVDRMQDRSLKAREIFGREAIAREGMQIERDRLAAQERQADRQFGLQERAQGSLEEYRDKSLDQNQKQFDSNMEFREKAFVENQRQFSITAGFERERLDLAKNQFDRSIFESDRQFGLDEKRVGLQERGVAVQELLGGVAVDRFRSEREDIEYARKKQEQFQQELGQALDSGDPNAIVKAVMMNDPGQGTALMNVLSQVHDREQKAETQQDALNNEVMQQSMAGVFEVALGLPKDQQAPLINKALQQFNQDFGTDFPTNLDADSARMVGATVMNMNYRAGQRLIRAVQNNPNDPANRALATIANSPIVQRRVQNNINKALGIDSKPETQLGKAQEEEQQLREQIEIFKNLNLPTENLEKQLQQTQRFAEDTAQFSAKAQVDPQFQLGAYGTFLEKTRAGKTIQEAVTAADAVLPMAKPYFAALDVLEGSTYAPKPGQDLFVAIGNFVDNANTREEREAAALLKNVLTKFTVAEIKEANLTPVSDTDFGKLELAQGAKSGVSSLRRLGEMKFALAARTQAQDRALYTLINEHGLSVDKAQQVWRAWVNQTPLFDDQGRVIPKNVRPPKL